MFDTKKKEKPSISIFHIIAIIISIMIIVPVLVLGYIGFLPVISPLMGASSPRDLGVIYAQQDLVSANSKLGIETIQLTSAKTPKETFKIAGSTPVNAEFTEEELTALINSHDEAWKYYPVSNCQLKINDDGVVEVSGVLKMDISQEYAEATDMPNRYKREVIDALGAFKSNPRFYAKGTITVNNGKVDGDLKEFEIGRMKLPDNWFNFNKNFVTSFIEDRIEKAGVNAESASFENGKLVFKGTIPEKVYFGK